MTLTPEEIDRIRERGWKCAAHNAVNQGAGDPADCGFPHCGCCPDAAEVIHALAESGELMDDETLERHRRARDGIVQLLDAIGPFASAATDLPASTGDASLVAIPFTAFSFRRARKAVDEVSRIALSDARGEDFIAHARVDVPTLLEALEASQDRVKRLEEALEPFAVETPGMPGSDDAEWLDDVPFQVGDIRRARAALQEGKT